MAKGVHLIWFMALLITLYLIFPLRYKLIRKNENYFSVILFTTFIIPMIIDKISVTLC